MWVASLARRPGWLLALTASSRGARIARQSELGRVDHRLGASFALPVIFALGRLALLALAIA
eukprot:8949067-Alexandrium_andersonii.AAC.1